MSRAGACPGQAVPGDLRRSHRGGRNLSRRRTGATIELWKGTKATGSGRLRHKHNWSLPKRPLLSGWVQHGYLAVVLARRKLMESNPEAERHGFQPIIQSARHLQRLRFERFPLRAVETHVCD